MLRHIRAGVCIDCDRRGALALTTAVHLMIGNVPADAAQSTRGEGYPNRPIRYVVGGSVGGDADSLARAIGQKLGEQWGQQVIDWPLIPLNARSDRGPLPGRRNQA